MKLFGPREEKEVGYATRDSGEGGPSRDGEPKGAQRDAPANLSARAGSPRFIPPTRWQSSVAQAAQNQEYPPV